MNRKIVSVILALILCFGLAISASAAPGEPQFVVDENGYLTADELNAMQKKAYTIYEETDVGIFYVFTTQENLVDYDIDGLVNGITDYVVMLENDTSWYTYYGGAGTCIDTVTEEKLRAAYDQTATYAEGVAAFLDTAAASFPHRGEINTNTTVGTIGVAGIAVYDEAELLSDAEKEALTETLLDVSHTYNAQITVATVAAVDDGDADAFVEYLYDSMGLGYGENHDGVLLLVCMDPREYRILSNGFAADAIEDGEIDAIGSAIQSDLSDGNYADAFATFADRCAYYLDGHINGFPFKAGRSLVVSVVIGAIAAMITGSVLQSELKSVRKQARAGDYVKAGSMQLTTQNDLFLYRTVDRREKEKSSNSSSGSSRNVGGGSF